MMKTQLPTQFPSLISPQVLRKAIRKKIIYLTEDSITYLHDADTKRKRTPEEEVRLYAYLHLVMQKSYSPKRIGIEKSIRIGTVHHRVDLVVYKDNQRDFVKILVECKQKKASERDFEKAIEQVQSYEKHINADFLWVTSFEKNAFFKTKPHKKYRKYVPLSYLPSASWREMLLRWWIRLLFFIKKK